MNAPETTSDSRFLFFMSDLLKDSKKFRMKYAQNHFESTFGSAYFKPNKTELKLAKTVKKEPRKARFPWDLGLVFGKPMRYQKIDGFNHFKTET